MDKLEELTQVVKEIRDKVDEYQRVHAQWAKWLKWAKEEPGFHEWASKNAKQPSELKARVEKISTKYKDIEVEYDEEMGQVLWGWRHLCHGQLDQLRLKRSQILFDLWRSIDDDGNWVYSLKEIADAYGISDTSMYKLLTVNEWFRARKNPGQIHISKKHLKPLPVT